MTVTTVGHSLGGACGKIDGVPPTTFTAVTALTPMPDAPGRFAAAIHPEWTIGGKPNGGYLLAMLGRAAAEVGTHPHPIAASAHYLRSPEPGPVEVCVEVLRTGRTASQLRTQLRQADELCIEALVTTSELRPDGEPYWDGLPRPVPVPFDECVRLPPVTPLGIEVAILRHAEVRLAPSSLGFANGRPSGSGELHGWLSLPESEHLDPMFLLYAVDAFPPATFEVEPTGWVPTLELTAYVRALPAPGPVQVLHKAFLIDAQRVDEACWVWDCRGRLVAHGTQLAGIRLG